MLRKSLGIEALAFVIEARRADAQELAVRVNRARARVNSRKGFPSTQTRMQQPPGGGGAGGASQGGASGQYGPGGAPGQYGQGGGAPQYGYGAPAGAYGQPQGYGYGMPPMQVGQYGPPMGYGYAPMGYPPPMYGMQPAWPRPNNRFSGPSTNQQFGMPTGVNPMQGGAGGNTASCRATGFVMCARTTILRETARVPAVRPRPLIDGVARPDRRRRQPGPVGAARPSKRGRGAGLDTLALPPGACGATPGGNLVISASAVRTTCCWRRRGLRARRLALRELRQPQLQWRTECKRCNAPQTADAQTIGKDSTISAPAPRRPAPTIVPAAAPAPRRRRPPRRPWLGGRGPVHEGGLLAALAAKAGAAGQPPVAATAARQGALAPDAGQGQGRVQRRLEQPLAVALSFSFAVAQPRAQVSCRS